MKVMFEFDTNSEDFDRNELETIQQAQHLASALFEIQEKVHSWAKHGCFPRMREQEPIDYVSGSEEYCKEINEFIKKHDIPDIYAIEDEINDIIIENGIDMERLGY